MVINLKIVFPFIVIFSFQSVSGKTLLQFKQEIMNLGAKVKTLENDVGVKNALYLEKLENAKKIESDIYELEDLLDEAKKNLIIRQNKTTRLIRSMALSLSEDEVTPQKEYFHVLQLQKHQIDQDLEKLATLDLYLKQKKSTLELVQKESLEIASTLRELESEKKLITESYLEKLELKNQTEMKFQKQKLQMKLSSLKRTDLSTKEIPFLKVKLPIHGFSQMIPSPKGVTLKFQDSQTLYSPKEGKVIYHGELASYGRVMMIDHGQDIRSVLLGPFESSLQKGDQVQSDQPIGFIKAQTTNSLYFEIRKRNIAQKTINWIDELSFSKI